MSESEWWFDGDYSECYYAPGHVSKVLFAVWVNEQMDEDDPEHEMVMAYQIEHITALETSKERFVPYNPDGNEYPDIAAHIRPMTRYQP